jgi:hypothetical protein
MSIMFWMVFLYFKFGQSQLDQLASPFSLYRPLRTPLPAIIADPSVLFLKNLVLRQFSLWSWQFCSWQPYWVLRTASSDTTAWSGRSDEVDNSKNGSNTDFNNQVMIPFRVLSRFTHLKIMLKWENQLDLIIY